MTLVHRQEMPKKHAYSALPQSEDSDGKVSHVSLVVLCVRSCWRVRCPARKSARHTSLRASALKPVCVSNHASQQNKKKKKAKYMLGANTPREFGRRFITRCRLHVRVVIVGVV